jgi:hypothetical protein
LAPLIWILTGVGLSEYGQTRARYITEHRPETFLALATLAAAGVLFAVLLLPRLSPIGPLLVGVLFLGLSLWNTFNFPSFYETMPREIFGVGFAATYPAEGPGLLLAIPLLATILSPRRWRRHDLPPAPGPQFANFASGPTPAYSGPAGYQPPTYSGPDDTDATRRI